MKKIIRILILCLGCIVACGLLPACSSAIEEPESGGGGDGSTVTLTIQAAVPDGTRADGSEVPDREKIDQLRIIVVDQTTHKVEHNQLHGFSYPEDEYNIEVEKNSTKDVYFLANAERWCLNFPKVGEIYNPDEDESEGDESDDGIIEARTTTMPSLFNQEIMDLPENLPYTSKYEIEVADKNVTATCYIAIAAVKFDIVFNNKTTGGITVSSLQIGGIANKSYLFPHNEEWDAWVENVTGNDEKAYFTNYEIPAETEHGVYPVTIPPTQNGEQAEGNTGESTPENTDNSFIVNEGTSYSVPTFYCHESKNVQQPVTRANGSDTEGEQSYTIEFLLKDVFYVYKISNSDTDYLKSLIRSTHVSITININSLDGMEDHDIVIWGKIEDWGTLETVEGGLEPIPVETKSN